MTEQLPRGTPAERAASSSRRLVLARRIVLGTFGVYPLLIVVLPLSVILGDPEPPGTLDVVGIAASVALAYLCMRIMRVRTISPPRRSLAGTSRCRSWH